MKVKLNQKGFAHLALVLLAVVLAVAAFAGYTVYQNRQDTIEANKTSTAVTGAHVQVINSKADLDTATNQLNNASLDNDLNPDDLNSDIDNLL
jgi:hypothetical protein